MGRFDREWIDELRAERRLLEAQLRKALSDKSRIETERDQALGEVRALRSVLEAIR